MDLRLVRGAAKNFGLSRLHRESGVARSRLYDFIAGADLNAENLMKVLECLGFGLKIVDYGDSKMLDASLAAYGVPVTGAAVAPKLTPEEALIGALRASSNDPMYFEFVVYLLTKTNMDLDYLMSSVTLDKHRRLLGYAADLAQQLSPDRDFRYLVLELKPKKNSNVIHIGPSRTKKGRFAKLREEVSENSIAKKWLVSTSTTPEMLQDRFAKWNKISL